VSDRPDQAVWTCSADCTPVLIGDVVTGQAAAIHSGWRGTAAGVVPKAIARFQANGSQLEQLRIALGPAIAGTVYQVTEDVANQVVSSLGGTWRDWLGTTPAPVLADPEPGKVRLDVRHTILHQLHQLGLHREQVAIAPHCTHQEPDLFFSYRRDAQKTVQWSGIVSRAA
jgi:polyphenol oxidase